jgi:RNA polymerase sigma-54 factor
MKLAHIVEVRQQHTQRIDPRQILASEILAWTTSELESAVEREMAENPALEARDSDSLVSLGILNAFASDTPASVPTAWGMTGREAAEANAAARNNTADNYWSPLPSAASALSGADWENDDPLERVASHLSLRDHLRQQVGQVASGQQADLVRYLIECVDDRGYLVADLAEIAEQFRVAPAEVEHSICSLQSMDPPGVGARDLRECLTLQLQYLEQAEECHPLAPRILSRCWDDLAARREDRIASRLRVPVEAVQEAMTFLQRSLTPYPGTAFRPSGSGRGMGGSPAVRPDLIFHRLEGSFRVDLTRDFEALLTVAPLWKRLAEQGETPSSHHAAENSDEAMRRYIRDHVERAQGFLSGVSRRGQTLRRIADALAEMQQGYLETGNRAFLAPLTRQTLAERLGLDESVVSRAVADKWAQLPGGEVIPLDAFFGNAHAVRDALATLIAGEDPTRPYSDDEIADLLTAQGFPLARRTVAKYRCLEKILPARLRRRGPEASTQKAA